MKGEGNMVISGKTALPRLMCLAGPVGAVLLGVMWKLIFRDTVIEGAWGVREPWGSSCISDGIYYEHCSW